MTKRFFCILFFLPFVMASVFAQKKAPKTEVSRKNFVSFGFEASPIIPTTLFNAAGTRIEYADSLGYNTRFTLRQNMSYRFGASLRFDIFNFKKMQLGNMFTFNTGIFYTNRSYRVFVDDVTNPVEERSLIDDRFKFVSYEIPLMLQLHLQASEKIWVNFAMGTGLEFYPFHVTTSTEDYEDGPKNGHAGYYRQYTARKFLLLAPLKASFGAEYRTEKSGYFGLGISISRPMPYMADTYLEYWNQPQGGTPYQVTPYGDIDKTMRNQGMFLSVDFRYYFQPSRNEKTAVPSYILERQKRKQAKQNNK